LLCSAATVDQSLIRIANPSLISPNVASDPPPFSEGDKILKGRNGGYR